MADSTLSICTRCSEPFEPEDQFCGSCGASLQKAPPSSSGQKTSEAPSPLPASKGSESPSDPPAHVPPPPPPPPPPPSSKKRNAPTGRPARGPSGAPPPIPPREHLQPSPNREGSPPQEHRNSSPWGVLAALAVVIAAGSSVGVVLWNQNRQKTKPKAANENRQEEKRRKNNPGRESKPAEPDSKKLATSPDPTSSKREDSDPKRMVDPPQSKGGKNSDAPKVDNPDKDRPTAIEDFKRLTGAWQIVAITVDGRHVPDAKGYTIEFKDGKLTMMDGDVRREFLCKLDPAKSPKRMDLTPSGDAFKSDDRFKDKGEPLLAVYELKGDQLRICQPVEKTTHRPSEFRSAKGSKLALMVLERADSDNRAPLIPEARDPASYADLSSALREFALASHIYHNKHGRFPTAITDLRDSINDIEIKLRGPYKNLRYLCAGRKLSEFKDPRRTALAIIPTGNSGRRVVAFIDGHIQRIDTEEEFRKKVTLPQPAKKQRPSNLSETQSSSETSPE